eukprot:692612-Prymnesium_polylepis.1
MWARTAAVRLVACGNCHHNVRCGSWLFAMSNAGALGTRQHSAQPLEERIGEPRWHHGADEPRGL